MADESPSLALLFKYSPGELRKNQKAISDEYARLLKTCRDAGLAVAGKRSKTTGTIVVFVDCLDQGRRNAIISWEHAVSSPTTGSHALPAPTTESPSPSTVLQALYAYITTARAQGGLEIVPKSATYPHIDLILSPHAPQYKANWLKKLKSNLSFGYGDEEITEMASMYGEPTALYFAFLTHYARSLVLPAVLGVGLHFEAPAFVQHPVYSVLLIVWAVLFTELWRQKYRRLSSTLLPAALAGRSVVALSSNGAKAADKSPWWLVETKTMLTIPLVVASVLFVCFNMTIAFLLEAFIARLYDGPLGFLAPLVPTVYNVLTTPPFVAIFTAVANKITIWEGHATQRGHDRSLLFKLLPVNSIVAFYALILSAGVYIPFGEELMTFFHLTLFEPRQNSTNTVQDDVQSSWRRAVPQPPPTSPKTRLGEQMFSFTLVLQLVPLAMEILVPFAIRYVTARLAARNEKTTTPGAKAELDQVGSAEQQLIETAVYEAGLPPHRFFEDYLTLVLQFGYGVMWSTTWTLTPAILLLLAVIRLRTDALKILVHYRRSIPTRDAADSASVWTGALSAITWAGALINAFLVLVVDPLIRVLTSSSSTPELGGPRPHRFDVPALVARVQSSDPYSFASFSGLRSHLSSVQTPLEKNVSSAGLGELVGSFWAPMGTAAVVLLASYAFFAVKWYVGHVFDSIAHDRASTNTGGEGEGITNTSGVAAPVIGSSYGRVASEAFWKEDEGESEITKKTI